MVGSIWLNHGGRTCQGCRRSASRADSGADLVTPFGGVLGARRLALSLGAGFAGPLQRRRTRRMGIRPAPPRSNESALVLPLSRPAALAAVRADAAPAAP